MQLSLIIISMYILYYIFTVFALSLLHIITVLMSKTVFGMCFGSIF